MHVAFGPLDCLVFEETALVTILWQTGITLLTRARLIARLVVGLADLRSGVCVNSIVSITRSERNIAETRGQAVVVMAIGLFINFLGGLALKEVFKILQVVVFKNKVTMGNKILDVFLGERIKEIILASLSSSSFFNNGPRV